MTLAISRVDRPITARAYTTHEGPLQRPATNSK